MEIRNIFGERIENPDLTKGKLVESFENVICKYKITKEGEGYWETIREYENGGKDVAWVETSPQEGQWIGIDKDGNEINIDITLIPEDACKELDFPIYNPFLIYREYTEEELKEQRIFQLSEEIQQIKDMLRDSDYIILKIVEGLTTLEECDGVCAYRQELRNQINNLEKEINLLNGVIEEEEIQYPEVEDEEILIESEK